MSQLTSRSITSRDEADFDLIRARRKGGSGIIIGGVFRQGAYPPAQSTSWPYQENVP